MSIDKLKTSIISKVLSGSELIKQALKGGNDILYSKKYPTGKYILDNDEYIRINEKDIEDVEDILNLLLGSTKSTIRTKEEERDIEAEFIQAKKRAERDGLTFTIKDKDLFKVYESLITIKDTEEEVEQEIEDEIDKSTIESEDETDDKEFSMSGSVSKLIDSVEASDGDIIIEDVDVEPSLDINEIDEEHKDSPFFNDKIYRKLDFKHLRSLKNKLLKSFKGYNGKISSYTPSKKFNLKKDIIDKDNIYYKNKTINGNKIKINFIVDMSGSMRGKPLINALSILWLFNELAREGYVEGNVIYTAENYESGKLHKTFPMTETEVLTIAKAWGPVEGIKTTADQYKHILKNTHTICITDGDITDVPIKKEMWDRLRVYTTGVYVNPIVKDIDELNRYKKNLLNYFHNGVVRENLDELINWFMKFKIKSKE